MAAARRKPVGKRLSADASRDWMRLGESLIHRYSDYLREVGELVERRSLEPKEWIGSYARLWSVSVADVGDFLQRRAGESLRPSDEWLQRFRQAIPKGQLKASISMEIPPEAIGEYDQVTLVTDGLSRGDREIVLKPGHNIQLVPEQVSRTGARSAVMQLFSLPLLEPGLYSGMVCARETDLPAAIVELVVLG